MAEVEYQGLTDLIEDFDKLPQRLEARARKRVERGAVNIKKAWKARWTGHSHIPHLPNAISYDIAEAGGTISAEVGPDKHKRQGPLGNLIEFGSINNAPIPGGAPALDEEEPRFVNTMQDLAETALDRVG